MSTHDAFNEAGRMRPDAARSWLERLQNVSSHDIQRLFEQVPRDRITPVAIAFALKMLELNQKRLLALYEEFRR